MSEGIRGPLMKDRPVDGRDIRLERLVGDQIQRQLPRRALQFRPGWRQDEPTAIIAMLEPRSLNFENLGLTETGVEGDLDDAPEVGRIIDAPEN